MLFSKLDVNKFFQLKKNDEMKKSDEHNTCYVCDGTGCFTSSRYHEYYGEEFENMEGDLFPCIYCNGTGRLFK